MNASFLPEKKARNSTKLKIVLQNPQRKIKT